MSAGKSSLLMLLTTPVKWALFSAVSAIPVLTAPKLLTNVIKPNGADTTITVCGSSVTLNAQNITGYSNPSWNDGSTGMTKTVTASGTYWWQETGTNVVTNGDFSSG